MRESGVRAALLVQLDLTALLGAELAGRLGVTYPDADGRPARLVRAVLADR